MVNTLAHTQLMHALRAGDGAAVDRMHPIYQLGLQTVMEAADGLIDLNEVARHFLASSGFGRSGEWVGEEQAAEDWAGSVPARG